MIVPASLLTYAILLLAAGAPALARARWPDRAPRLAVSAWLALTGTAVASVVLAGLALSVPEIRLSSSFARLVRACALALRAQYAHPGGAVLASAGFLLALAVTGQVCWHSARTVAGASLARRRHRRGLAITGRLDHRLGAVVVDHDDPAAWCLPGTGRPVVLTTAAINALDHRQLEAVLAHERAHQRGKHHILLAIASSLAAAFPFLAAFRTGHEQVSRLVELLADDAAITACPRLTVAEAILTLSAPAPTSALLSAGGPGTAARVRRLITAPRALGRSAMVGGTLAITTLVLFPILLLAAPALAVIGEADCPIVVQHTAASATVANYNIRPGLSVAELG